MKFELKSRLRIVIAIIVIFVAGLGIGGQVESAKKSATTLAPSTNSTDPTKYSFDLRNYYPQQQECIEMYSSYNNGQLIANTTNTIKKSNPQNGENAYTWADSGGTNGSYLVGKDIAKNIDQTDLSKPSTTILLSTQKSEWLIGDKINSQITGIKKEISTKAGVFENCIEVTSTEINNDKVTWTEKDYYAPNIGWVYSQSSDGMIIELTGVSYTSSTVPNSTQTINPNISTSNNIASSNYSKEIAIPYINNTYDFNLALPKSWEGKYSVTESKTDNIVSFNLIVDGNSYGNIFSIQILNKESTANDFTNNDFAKFICTHGGKTFVYMPAAEPTTAALNNASILKLLMKMVNEDVPQIVKTIKFKS